MKRKILSTFLTLALVLSFSLVMATPVSADLEEATITVNPATGTATAVYQVDFFAHAGLTEDVNCFVIEFPAGTTVPGTILPADVEIYDITALSAAQTPSSIEVDGQTVRVYMPAGGPGIMAFHYGRVVFKIGAGIVNPAAIGEETFCAWIYSDQELEPVPVEYEIFETAPIDVFLKYQIPPADCGDVVDILVGTFLTIGEALDFVDELYQSGATADFTVDGAATANTYNTVTAGAPADGSAIGDGLDITDITWDEDETFDVTYNTNTGSQPTANITVTDLATISVVGSGVVDVVSVVGAGQGATPGYQNTFNLTGDTHNDTAGAYGDFGITAPGWTDGSSIGEALVVDVTANPSPTPETYTVEYTSDDATTDHLASLTVQTDGTYVWSPAAPTNVVDITDFWDEERAWYWYDECPEDGGLIGARVLVRNGIYLETINIRTPGVMVESENGADVTIIDAEGLDPAGLPGTMHIAAVMITAEGVTFGGTDKGFTVKNAGVGVDAGGIGPDSMLWADDNYDGIADVSGVYIWPNGGAYYPQHYVHDAWSRVSVINNIIKGSQARGIRADNALGTFDYEGVSVYVGENTVYDNLFDGFSGDGLCVGPLWLDPGYTFNVHTGNEWGDTAIVENEFYHNGGSGMGTGYSGWTDAGIEIGSTVEWYGERTCYIVGNNIHDNTHAGIHLLDNATNDTLVIKFNQIVDNGVFGISTKADKPLKIACVYNNISGNPDWGIKNWEPQDGGYYPWSMLVAKLNWWGDKSGPSDGIAPLHPSEDDPDQTAEPPALGVGDAVSHFVIYQWWLTYPFEDVQEDLIRYYGSDRGLSQTDLWTEIVPLELGWNTLSTPVALDERADEMGEICALGGWMQNYIIAYSYDAVSGWNLVLGDFQFLPLEAIYIRMSGPDYLPILLRNTDWMPARDLEPGWNLVSLNVGFHDRDIQYQYVDVTLASISGSWSNAISPSMPGQRFTWVCTSTTTGNCKMSIGDGYWVFITKSTTLAGSRMAPWYLEQWEMDILNCGLPPWMLQQ